MQHRFWGIFEGFFQISLHKYVMVVSLAALILVVFSDDNIYCFTIVCNTLLQLRVIQMSINTVGIVSG